MYMKYDVDNAMRAEHMILILKHNGQKKCSDLQRNVHFRHAQTIMLTEYRRMLSSILMIEQMRLCYILFSKTWNELEYSVECT